MCVGVYHGEFCGFNFTGSSFSLYIYMGAKAKLDIFLYNNKRFYYKRRIILILKN